LIASGNSFCTTRQTVFLQFTRTRLLSQVPSPSRSRGPRHKAPPSSPSTSLQISANAPELRLALDFLGGLRAMVAGARGPPPPPPQPPSAVGALLCLCGTPYSAAGVTQSLGPSPSDPFRWTDHRVDNMVTVRPIGTDPPSPQRRTHPSRRGWSPPPSRDPLLTKGRIEDLDLGEGVRALGSRVPPPPDPQACTGPRPGHGGRVLLPAEHVLRVAEGQRRLPGQHRELRLPPRRPPRPPVPPSPLSPPRDRWDLFMGSF